MNWAYAFLYEQGMCVPQYDTDTDLFLFDLHFAERQDLEVYKFNS